MEKFAKIFENEEVGQILVELNSNGEGNPAVMIKFIPEGYWICTVGPTFTDDKAGWDSATKFFDTLSESEAIKLVKQTIASIPSTSCE